jgi:hypothetical protein
VGDTTRLFCAGGASGDAGVAAVGSVTGIGGVPVHPARPIAMQRRIRIRANGILCCIPAFWHRVTFLIGIGAMYEPLSEIHISSWHKYPSPWGSCDIFNCVIVNHSVLWKEFQHSGTTKEIPFIQCFSKKTERKHQQWCIRDFYLDGERKMKKKLMVTCAAILVLSMITAPVMAGPANPLDQILTIVKDIQKKVDTSQQAPPEPTSYEYYTAVLRLRSETSTGYTLVPHLVNNGDTPADACYERYYCDDYTFCHPYTLDDRSQCITIDPMSVSAPFYWMNDPSYSNYWKFTTTSKNVVPSIYLVDWETHEIVTEYLPGDFLKVEKYD